MELYFIQGFLIGLFVSLPIGPVGILCIQRTLQQGKLSGFISGLGAASADTFFAGIASLGLTMISDFFQEQRFYIVLGGAVILIFLGVQMFFRNTIKQVRNFKYKKSNPVTDFVSAFALTITNPLMILFYGIVFASFDLVQSDIVFTWSVLSGIFISAICVWFLLATLVNVFRKFFRLRIIFYINKIAGIIMILFGISAGISAFSPKDQQINAQSVPNITKQQ